MFTTAGQRGGTCAQPIHVRHLQAAADATGVHAVRPPLLQAVPGQEGAHVLRVSTGSENNIISKSTMSLVCYGSCSWQAPCRPAMQSLVLSLCRLACRVIVAYTLAQAIANESLAELHACPLQFPEPVASAAAAVADRRGMRMRKVPKACPTCKADIADFLRTAQENREMADVITRLQRAAREARVAAGLDEAGENVVCAGVDADHLQPSHCVTFRAQLQLMSPRTPRAPCCQDPTAGGSHT